MFLSTLCTWVPVVSCADFQDLPSVTQAPPPLSFEPKRLLKEDDFKETYSLSFPSAFVSKYPVNNTVRAQLVLPKNRVGKVPVVLLLHYWGATDHRLEDEMAENLANAGSASVVISLPFHLDRTPQGFNSGELAIQPDPQALKATMIQAVLDIRRTVDWIIDQPEIDSTRIGITGTSLGAIVSSLAFAVDKRFTSGAIVLGGVDLAHILWNSSRVVSQRDRLRQMGYTEDSLREVLKEVEPANYLGPNETRPVYVVQARHDTVIPAQSTQKLVNLLEKPQRLYLDSGHYGGALVQGRLLRSVTAFFVAEFKGQPFKAPADFYVPTIRFGLQADIDSGLNVAASLDVWRLNDSGDVFASVMFTPRGARGFLGGTLGKGFALGFVFLPKKTTFGMVWNTVF